MSDYDSTAIPTTVGSDFWFAEKTMWYQDHVIYGCPIVEIYSRTASGGNAVTGIAPTETFDKRAEYKCAISSPSEDEILKGIMLESDRRIIFYIDSTSEVFPDNVDQIRVNNTAYEIIATEQESESGRCEIICRPLSEQGRAGI